MLGPERARDADQDLFVAGLHHALRRDGVLGVEGGDQRGAVDPEAGELLGREFHIDALVLRPEDVDLRDVRQFEELLADVVDRVPELTMGEPVGGEAIDDPIGVAELVVEAGADDALRQVVPDVVDLLAHLIPDVRNLGRRRRILQADEDRGPPGGRVAFQIVEVRRLLELALEAVGDLLERVADRGAGPADLHDHGLDGEVRILASPEPEVGPHSSHDDDEHEIDHERTVADRPFGEVEAHHTAPRMRTFWPGRSVCTPAVTTSAPVSSPWEITTEAGIVAQDLDVAQGDGLAQRIDHPHGRAPVRLGQRARRDLDAGRGRKPETADDGGPEPHGFRRIDDADLDLECPGRGIRLRRDLPHPAGRLDLRVVAEGELDRGILRAIADELLRDIENGVASALARELHDRLPGVNHLARLGADRGDSAGRIGEQHGVALLLARDPDLRLRGVDLGLNGQELLLGVVEIGPRRPAVLEERLLPLEGEPRLGQHRLERGEVGLSRAQRIVLDLGIEPADQLVRGEHVADMDRPLDHPAVDAKGETDLVLGANLAGERDHLAFHALLDGDGPNRPIRLGGRRRFVAAR